MDLELCNVNRSHLVGMHKTTEKKAFVLPKKFQIKSKKYYPKLFLTFE